MSWPRKRIGEWLLENSLITGVFVGRDNHLLAQ